MKNKNERIFKKFSQINVNVEPTEIGREQFFNQQSFGIHPKDPDPYFIRLLNGKKWFDWQIQEYMSLYLSNEWWGWYTIFKDYKNEQWLIPKLFPWRKDIKEIIKSLND